MRLLSNLIGVWIMKKGVSSSAPLLLRMLMMVAAAGLLALVAVLLTVVFVGGVLWLAYAQMMAAGFDAFSAVVVILGMVLAVLAGIFMVIYRHYCAVRRLLRRIQSEQAPVASRVNHIVNSFVDGYRAESLRAR